MVTNILQEEASFHEYQSERIISALRGSHPIGVDWNGLVCGARKLPHDGSWIIVVSGVSEGDLDTASEYEGSATDRDGAINKLCDLAEDMVRLRQDDGI